MSNYVERFFLWVHSGCSIMKMSGIGIKKGEGEIGLKKRYVILFTIGFFAILFSYAQTKAATQLGWDQRYIETYEQTEASYTVCYSYDDTECWIRQIKLHPKKADTSVLKIPGVIKGAKVTRIGSRNAEGDVEWYNVFGTLYKDDEDQGEWFTPNTKSVKQIILPDTIDEILYLSFAGMTNLEKINLPKNLRELNKGVFQGCKKLKGVKIPAKTEKIDFKAFSGCESFEWIKVAKKNKKYQVKDGALLSKDGTKLYTWTGKYNLYKVPQGVKIIKKQASYFFPLNKVHLSSSVSKIEAGALNCYSMAPSEITISEKNKTFAKAGNCIYNKKTGDLTVAVGKFGVVEIPKKVSRLVEGVSWGGGGEVKKIIIPASVKYMQRDWYRSIWSSGSTETVFKSSVPPERDLKEGQINSLVPGGNVTVPRKSFKSYKNWFIEAGSHYGITLNGGSLEY